MTVTATPKKFSEAKFIKTRFTGLDGRVVIAWTEETATPDAFSIRVTMSGLKFTGTMECEIQTENDIQAYAQLISEVWAEQRKLAPKITTNLRGH